MGAELYRAFPEARAVFDEADRRLGFGLSRLCFEGPEEDLRLTENTQPAILTTSIAAFQCLQGHRVRFDFVAGHSLGEYSAVVAGGGLDFGDAVEAVRSRGRFMQEAVPVGEGSMAAILGLDVESVVEVCGEVERELGECVSAANINSPGQIVVAGSKAGVAEAGRRLLEAGARRALELPVSAPFHCALMEPAGERLRPILESLHFRDLEKPLVNNVDAAFQSSADQIRLGLIRQVSSSVRWLDSILGLIRAGVSEFVEVGPGKVLSGLIRKTDREVAVANIENPQQLEAYVSNAS